MDLNTRLYPMLTAQGLTLSGRVSDHLLADGRAGSKSFPKLCSHVNDWKINKKDYEPSSFHSDSS